MIEARIVKASDSFKREAGIRWGTAGNISWGDSPERDSVRWFDGDVGRRRRRRTSSLIWVRAPGKTGRYCVWPGE